MYKEEKYKLQNKKSIKEVLQIILSIKGAFPKARNLSEIKMRFSNPLKLSNKRFKQKKKYTILINMNILQMKKYYLLAQVK